MLSMALVENPLEYLMKSSKKVNSLYKDGGCLHIYLTSSEPNEPYKLVSIILRPPAISLAILVLLSSSSNTSGIGG